jgi:tRNA-dihydrouridine synthase
MFGNGDVVDGATAKRLMQVSGCEGVMLGRGALGNPWIYREVEAVLAGEPAPAPPPLAERRRVLLEHVALQQAHEERPVGHLRRIISWYFRECPGVAEFRDRINRAQSVAEMRELIERFQGLAPSHSCDPRRVPGAGA